MDQPVAAIISELLCEHHRASFGIGEARQRLSWIAGTFGLA
jgi:hypothetical protein